MKILFLGTHGQFNLGDELLLETFLAQLGKRHHYAVNSYDPAFTQGMLTSQFDVESFHTTKELPRFLKNLITSDLIFFGGGSIIKELYASVGRNPYSTLFMILATVTFAKQIARKKVLMSNIGVGPIMTPNGERLARWILNQVDILSVRDDKSLQTALKLGLSPTKIRRVPDAVFANPPEVFLPNPISQTKSDQLRLALNLNYDIENREAWDGFVTSLAESLCLLDKTRKLEIHALPMQSKFKANDDLSVLKEFSKRIPELKMVFHEPHTAQDVAAIIAGCDIVLAERLHTLVISSVQGKPFFGLIYDVKVHELIDYLGMLDHSLDINHPFSAQILTDGIQQVVNDSDKIHAHLIERSTSLRKELTAYFDDLRSKVLA